MSFQIGYADFISCATFVRLSDHVILKKEPYDAPSIKRGDIVYVSSSLLSFFFKNIFPHIEEPFILVSGKSITTVGEKYFSFLDSDKLLHWFGINITFKHPKATLIPVGISWFLVEEELSSLNSIYEEISETSFFNKKSIEVYVNWSETDRKRDKLWNYFSSWKEVKRSYWIPFSQYIAELSDAQFVISPRGYNIDCFRTWEALYSGSIPVVESLGIDKLYEDLPVIVVQDLSKVTIEDLKAAFEILKTREFNLEKLNETYWIDQIRKIQENARNIDYSS